MENINKLETISNLTVIDYTHTGLGIVKNKGQVIFVEDVLIDEVVNITIYKYEKKIAYAKVDNFIKVSNNRVTPICEHYNECGGCNIMHLNYKEQINLKYNIIKNIFFKSKLSNNKVLENFKIIPNDNPLEYRNKVVFTFSPNKELIENIDSENYDSMLNRYINYIDLGFNKKKTNDIVNINRCHLISENMNNVVQNFKQHVNDSLNNIYDICNLKNFKSIEKNIGILKKLTIRENLNKELMVVLEISEDFSESSKINSKWLYSLVENFYKSYNNIINFSIVYKYKVLKEYQKNDFLFKINNKNFLIGPNSFFQVNTNQTIKLYDSIKSLISDDSENILDAYSGVGSIGIYAYQSNTNLYGFEIVDEAVKNSLENLRINNIESGTYICANLERYIKQLEKINVHFDTIIIDPPRKGISKQFIDFLLKDLPKEIICVSCSVQTLSRDLNLLKDKYNITFFEAYDMFSQTSHIETLCKLELKR